MDDVLPVLLEARRLSFNARRPTRRHP